MKTRTILSAFIFALLLMNAVAHEKINDVQLTKETIIRAKASGKMILTGSKTFGDRYVAEFLDRNFIVQSDVVGTEGAFLSIYDSNGRLVHRVINDPTYPYELAVKIKRGLNSETQYYPLLRRFNGGERSVDLLRNVIMGADDANDVVNAPQLMEAYINQLPEAPSESELAFVATYTKHIGDPGFAYLMQREVHLNKLADLIFQDVLLPQVSSKSFDASVWIKSAKDRYPQSLAPHLDRMLVELLEMRNDEDGLNAFIPEFMEVYKGELSDAQMAYYAGLVSK